MRTLEVDETVAVLQRNGLGVLAFDDGPYPYPVPVAYGYDADSDLFVVQLEGESDSHKHRCLTHNPNVGFTVYEETEPNSRWRSVVLQGELVETSYQDAEAAFATLARNTQGAPNPVLWEGTAESTTLTPYELDIDTTSGREFLID